MAKLPLVKRGKVRDVYQIDSNHLLIVASDRVSAFDVVLPSTIPGKGTILTNISKFWFDRTAHIIPNHTQNVDIPFDYDQLVSLGHTPFESMMFVRSIYPIPIEAIVRGYLVGSAWKEYQETGQVAGIQLREGMQFGDRIAAPIFTPTSKAPAGEHDANINYDDMCDIIGDRIADRIIEVSVRLYKEAADYLIQRGIIIADTKFEFGYDPYSGTLTLIDELLTPDSSRFWKVSDYRPGDTTPFMDKQIVRDYLESIGWDKTPPGPHLPDHIIRQTAEKYQEIHDIILS